MKIAVIGTGHMGVVVAAGFAESGHRVVCVGDEKETAAQLQQGKVLFYEPGLEELLKRNIEEERLDFTTDLEAAVSDCLLVFLCVPATVDDDGVSDCRAVFEAAKAVGAAMSGYRLIVLKSTCPVGSAEKVREAAAAATHHPLDVVVNPEFFKEGAALNDFMRPDRVVVGGDDVRVIEIMRELYAPFLRTGKPFIATSSRSAELARYAVDSMLASRVSLMNELANIAEAYQADIKEVQEVLMADSRIGSTYLFPGLGFGGASLPVSPMAAARMAREKGLTCAVLEATIETNEWQKRAFLKRITDYYGSDISQKRLAVWGASYKSRTDDLRRAPALAVINGLLAVGAEVLIYDPVAGPKLTQMYGDQLKIVQKMYSPLKEADGLIIGTEWREFHHPDFDRLASMMREKVIFDGRNLLSPKVAVQHGFRYFSIGRPAASPKG